MVKNETFVKIKLIEKKYLVQQKLRELCATLQELIQKTKDTDFDTLRRD